MENVISKRQETRTDEYLIRNNIMLPLEPDMTLEEVLARCPFTRKKHEEAVETLTKYPVPKELLEKLGLTSGPQL